MRNRKLILLILWSLSFPALSQELNCSVAINASQIQTSDGAVFNDLEKAIEQFMNGRKWTNDNFKQHEKIGCNLLITITRMPAIGNFTASVQIQSARPVYNSTYTSLVLNFADRDWEFDYVESMPLEYNDNTFTNNLTSMLAFYAYLIIGMDYDSFSELGGSPYFQRALQVVNNAQSSGMTGWQAMGSNRNRYWIIENINNPQMAPLRKSLYQYHRHGLDAIQDNPDESRLSILDGLREVKKVRDINPSAIFVISFFDAKGKELDRKSVV